MSGARVVVRVPHGVLDAPSDSLRAFIAEVERSTIDGVFTGDHVSFHDGTGYDGLIQATAMAATSQRLTIWTAVYLLALRHPVPAARQVGSLAALAPGRFVFGVGLGGEDPHELEICGVDPRTRGRRLDAHLEVVRELLAGHEVHRDADGLLIPGAILRPVPEPRVPILVGGRSDAAMRRVARLGDGWIGVWVRERRAAESLATIAEHAAANGRHDPPARHALLVWCGLGPSAEAARSSVAPVMERLYKLPFSNFERHTPCGRPEDVAAAIAPYVQLGFTDVLINAVASDPAAVVESVDEVARHLHGVASPPTPH